MVFQAYHLLPELNALENVLAPLLVRYSMAAWWRVRSEATSPAIHPVTTSRPSMHHTTSRSLPSPQNPFPSSSLTQPPRIQIQ